MRERDDDEPVGAVGGSLAEGVGETTGDGGALSSAEPYGDTDLGDDAGGDEPYEDEDEADDADGDDAYADESYEDEVYEDDEDDADGATYGDGDPASDDLPDDAGADPAGVDESVTEDEPPFDGADLAHDGSPLDGIDFLVDEVREALFAPDDDPGTGPLDTDPVDLETDTDLDLTGDGLVDTADLHEAASPFDFDVSDGH